MSEVTSTKVCGGCHRSLPATAFNRMARSKDGLQSQCRECHRAYWAKPENKARAKRNDQIKHRRRTYGVSQEQYTEMFSRQDGRCAVCRTPHRPTRLHPELLIDHSHETGVVRGLLCFHCNTALGHLGDDPRVVRAAAAYLEGGGGHV